MQQKKTDGAALPNMTPYYHAALLEAIIQWWNLDKYEQLGVRTRGSRQDGC